MVRHIGGAAPVRKRISSDEPSEHLPWRLTEKAGHQAEPSAMHSADYYLLNTGRRRAIENALNQCVHRPSSLRAEALLAGIPRGHEALEGLGRDHSSQCAT